MKFVVVRDAAELLGVSEVQIGRLIAAGDLNAVRVGRSWVIGPDDLRRYAALRPARGRPLSVQAAWRALLAEQPEDLQAARRLAARARRRSGRCTGRVDPGQLEHLLADRRVVLGGADAAAHHGAAVAAGPTHDIYVRASDAEAIVADYLVDIEADAPNLVFRRVADGCWPFRPDQHVGPLALAAIDLIDALDERSAIEAIDELVASR